MTNITKNADEAFATIRVGDCLSKVTSKRNYVIIIREKCATLYPFGEAQRKGLLRSVYLWEIVKYGITWAFFSKIADAKKTLSTLEKYGYQIK